MLEHSCGVAHELMLMSQRMEEQLSAPLSAGVDDDISDMPLSYERMDPEVAELVTIEDMDADDDDINLSQDGPQSFATFPYSKRIIEICNLIAGAAHEAKEGRDHDICKSTCEQLRQIYERFVEALADENGIIASKHKTYKTLKQLSRASRTFQGRRIENVPRRTKRGATKVNRGDPVGMQQVNRTIQEMNDIQNIVQNKPQIIERELWGDSQNATDAEMMQAYLNVSGDIYLHELDKMNLKRSKPK